ncbi:MAG TPA: hypothetical protein VF077_13260 [Nitrospiraceae bacterium]
MTLPLSSRFQGFSDLGELAEGYKLNFYYAGTALRAPTFTDATGDTENVNPVVLDARGEAPVWISPGVVYDVVFTTDADVTIWTDANIMAPDASQASYTPSGTGASTTTVDDELDRTIVTDMRFMSEVQKGDVLSNSGLTDVTSPIQKALDYAMTNGLTLDAVPGTRLVSATLNISTGSCGLWGRGINTVFKRTGDYGDTFKFTGNDTTGALINGNSFGNLAVKATGLMSSGAHLWLNGCELFMLGPVHLLNGFYALRLSGCSRVYSHKLDVLYNDLHGGTSTGRTGLLMDLAGVNYGHRSCTEIQIVQFDIQGPTAGTERPEFCIRTTGCDGAWLIGGHTRGGATADIELDAAEASSQIGSLRVVNCHVDAVFAGQVGIHLKNNVNEIFNCRFTDIIMHGGAAGFNGILADASVNADGVDFDDITAFQFAREGVKLLGGRNYDFDNAKIRGNSRGGTGTYSGIYIENVAGARFAGGNSGRDEPGQVETDSQKYGLEIGTGCTDITGTIDLDRNVSGSLGGAGAGVYRWGGGLLDKTPATITAQNLMAYGGIGLSGGAYLDGNAFTGMVDSKQLTAVMKFNLTNAAGSNETILDSTAGGSFIQRTATGNLQIVFKNAAAANILVVTTTGAQCALAGTYILKFSVDMAVAGSTRIYINGVQNTISVSTFTNDTLDLTVAEWSIGASVAGANPAPGNYYALWIQDGLYTEFNTETTRRQWATKGNVLQDWGLKGEKPTGSQPRVFFGYNDVSEFGIDPRGSSTTVFTYNGTPTSVTVEDYTYSQNLLHGVTSTAASHKVGRFVSSLTANRAGTTTLDLSFLASKSIPGRQITIRTIQAQTVVSGASDVVPLAGGAASTPILAATAGKSAVLELNSNNTTWTIINAN